MQKYCFQIKGCKFYSNTILKQTYKFLELKKEYEDIKQQPNSRWIVFTKQEQTVNRSKTTDNLSLKLVHGLLVEHKFMI